MIDFLRSALIAAVALTPAAALAQYVVLEPPMVMAPAAGPLDEEDAAAIAMMHGIAVVEDVDYRIWDGNFEVEGTDVTGNDIEMTIDHDTGEVLEIDD